MSMQNLSIGIAFMAGLASFLSPCVLSLVPAYVGYLGGWTLKSSGGDEGNRWISLVHGLAFVLGFSLIFILAGAFLGAVGYWLNDWRVRQALAKVGGVVVILFGLHTMGVVNFPYLNYDTRHQIRPDPRLGFLSSLMMGIFFSTGWSPCVGPILGAIYTVVLSGGNVQSGVIMLSAYSAGMAVPFLLAALGVEGILGLMRRHSRAIHILSIGTGVLLVILGIMLFSGTLERLAQFAPLIDFGY